MGQGAIDLDADLVELALSDPGWLLANGRSLLEQAGCDPAAASRVQRAIGNAHRELRRPDAAHEHLLCAVSLAADADRRDLEGLALMSLAAVELYRGDLPGALDISRRALSMLTGADRLLALSQHAALLCHVGQNRDGLEALGEALALVAQSGDRTLECDLLVNRTVVRGYLGEIGLAIADGSRALELATELRWPKRAADVVHNLGWLAGRNGDLVGALRHFDDAARRYEELGMPPDSIYPDRCEVLLAAGLADEALRLAERAARALDESGDAIDRAEALLLVARAARAVGELARCRDAALSAADVFEAGERAAWASAARLLAVDARLAAGEAAADDLDECQRIVDATRDALPAVATEALIVGARAAVSLGRAATAAELVDGVDRVLAGPDGAARTALVEAQILLADHRDRDALARCEAGLRELDDAASTVGASELRVRIRRHGVDLSELGVRLSFTTGDAATVLEWVERHRARATEAPSVRPPDDEEFAEALASLRAARARLASDDTDGSSTALRRECIELEERVRRHARRAGGSVHRHDQGPIRDRLAERLSGSSFVEWFEVDRMLHAAVVTSESTTISPIGACSSVQTMASQLRRALARRCAEGGTVSAHTPAEPAELAGQLDHLLFGALGDLGDDLVLSPTASLHALPWGIVPTTASRRFTIIPSAAAWISAHDRAPRHGAPVVVAGPGLVYARREAEVVASLHTGSTLLVGDDATSGRIAEAIVGTSLLHLACHGTFSAENPMFSSLLLADGPVFLYDVERIVDPPSIAVLAACHGGMGSVHPGDELLGFTSSLLGAGARSVIASCVALPDSERLVAVSAALHGGLSEGAAPAAALLEARHVDPEVGGALVCVGIG